MPPDQTSVQAGQASMRALCDDLRDECQELDLLTRPLRVAEWVLRTRFYGWTVWDELAHLHLFDELAFLAAQDREEFLLQREAIERALAGGQQVSEYAREHYSGLDGPTLAAAWRIKWQALAVELETVQPKDRLPWFGPEMSARSFVTARIMETWAHGQDIWDALGRQRPPSTRLAHIAQLGVLTFNWSFTNRGLRAPGEQPHVILSGPADESWKWGPAQASGWIRGTALDFCLVVTQRRHYLDTNLEIEGTAAREWMQIAQCFAGPPSSGPGPGTLER